MLAILKLPHQQPFFQQTCIWYKSSWYEHAQPQQPWHGGRFPHVTLFSLIVFGCSQNGYCSFPQKKCGSLCGCLFTSIEFYIPLFQTLLQYPKKKQRKIYPTQNRQFALKTGNCPEKIIFQPSIFRNLKSSRKSFHKNHSTIFGKWYQQKSSKPVFSPSTNLDDFVSPGKIFLNSIITEQPSSSDRSDIELSPQQITSCSPSTGTYGCQGAPRNLLPTKRDDWMECFLFFGGTY